MKLKKLSALALATLMTLGLLSGCGGNSGNSGNTGDSDSAASADNTPQEVVNEIGSDSDDATPLEMWTFVELHQKVYTEMVNKWNENNPDKQIKITINNMPYDDMHNKLLISLNAGEGAPDMSDIEIGKFPNFTMGTPMLRDLTQEAQPYIEDIVKSRLDMYSKDGKIYGYPTHVGATVAFYNTELLEAAGIDYTTIKTWDDFTEAGSKYYEATGKNFGCVETSAHWTLNMILAQLGADYLDENGKPIMNGEGVVEALTILKKAQDANAVATIAGGQPDKEEAYGAYNSGEYAVQIMPLWEMSRFTAYMTDLKGKIAIAPPPVPENATNLTVGGGGTGTVVIAGKENEDLAAEFLAYAKLSYDANVGIWETLGFDPCNMEIWEDEAVTHNPDNIYVQYFINNPFDVLNELKTGIGGLKSSTYAITPSINNVLDTVTLNSIFEDGEDIQTALDDAQMTVESEAAALE